jgi:hypothetical protein
MVQNDLKEINQQKKDEFDQESCLKDFRISSFYIDDLHRQKLNWATLSIFHLVPLALKTKIDEFITIFYDYRQSLPINDRNRNYFILRIRNLEFFAVSLDQITELKYMNQFWKFIFQLKSLQGLSLTNCNITVIPKDLSNLPKLSEIHFDFNLIQDYPSFLIDNLSEKGLISIEHNLISHLPEKMKSHPSLLNGLSFNPIFDIMEYISTQKKIPLKHSKELLIQYFEICTRFTDKEIVEYMKNHLSFTN